ncbi:MAG: cardiolipin synthase [Sulfurimonas sp.]|nr:cardiolipin synthase [Sulfurimonas sp.]
MSIDVANIIFYHSLIIFGELLVIIVLVHMLYKRRSPANITAWLLLIVLIPYVAVILYFIFGFRKRKNRYKKENIKLQGNTHVYPQKNPLNEVLRSYGIPDATSNENFELFTDPILAYKELISCVENAKTSIYISTYIFNYDNTTKNIIDSLIKKAKDGVEIKILIDSLGSIELYLFQNRIKKLRDAGAKIEFFMPIFRMPFRNYINLRNHRKIFIFDNNKILSGGMNISNDYLGETADKTRWEDMLFLVEGASTEQYFEIFASDWFYASEEKLTFAQGTIIKNNGNTFVQVVPSGPDMSKDVLYEALLCAIYSAKERIWIVTPYFVPDDSIVQALIIAKHKGLDVRLITPKKTNHPIVNLVRASYMRELEEVGIDIYLYNGAMLHAKAILFDSSSTMLGSVNLDNRSLFLNYEVATFVYSEKVIENIQQWMQKLLFNSSIGTQEVSTSRRIVENTMRILAPQL